MADELNDGVFWLPSEFLTDDELLMDFKGDRYTAKKTDEFSPGSGFNSDLSSPVESVLGSTETESDEDDFITGLTRKIASPTLQDSYFSSDYNAKGWKLSGSPQSPLCMYKPGSSRGSPNCVSQVLSPPEANGSVGFDLLYAAAEEVARMRMIEEFYAHKPFTQTRKPSPVSVPLRNPSTLTGLYPTREQQLHAAQLMYQNQMMQSGVRVHGNNRYEFQSGNGNGDARRAQSLSIGAWPTLQQSQSQAQQKPGSAKRVVFLGETGAKKERTGTGVFLPRRIGTNPTETRKKAAGCPVMLPERVVHALNMNIESSESPSQLRCNGNFTAEYDAVLKHRNNVLMAQQQQRRNLIAQQSVLNQELRLPQEWTY